MWQVAERLVLPETIVHFNIEIHVIEILPSSRRFHQSRTETQDNLGGLGFWVGLQAQCRCANSTGLYFDMTVQQSYYLPQYTLGTRVALESALLHTTPFHCHFFPDMMLSQADPLVEIIIFRGDAIKDSLDLGGGVNGRHYLTEFLANEGKNNLLPCKVKQF